MVAALKDDRILTSPRDGNIRLSWHCYNSEEDVEAVVAGLERHSDLLAR
jgi:selenocysteine lyase/cysteine desulfurase